MLTIKRHKLSVLGSLCLALALGVPAARAATCPPNANTTGVGITLSFAHQNGTFIGAEGADACETIKVVAVVSYPNGLPGQIIEAFSGGTILINGNNVTPVGGVPLIGPASCAGAVLVVASQTANYTITAADIAAGKATVTASYSGGLTTSGEPVSAQTSQDTTVKPAVTVTVSQPSAVCQGLPVTLTANVTGGIAPYTIVWNNGSTQVGSGTTFSPSTTTAGSTVYTVVLTDSQNCTGQTTVPVVVNPNPIVTVNSPSTCQTSSGVLTATVTGSTAPTFHYVWTGPAGTGPFTDTASIVATVAGNYSVTVTDANGCVGHGSGVLTITPKPTVTVNNASICSGTSATLTATVNGVATPFHFVWAGPAGSGSFADSATITTTVAGSYSVTVTDANGCTGTGTGTVSVNAKPGLQVSSAVICSGTTGTLTATAVSGAGVTFTYVWTGPTGSGPFGNTASITTGVAGTYTVVVTDSNGCTATGTGVVVVNPNPIVTVSNATACQGNSAIVTATVTGSAAPTFHYAWTGPAGTGPFADSASIPVTVAGPYSVTVTDANGCVGHGSGVLTITPKPVVTVSSNPVCALTPATVSASVSGTATPFHFVWTGPSGSGPFADAATFTTTVAGSYSVTVTDANGCTATGTGTVTILAQPRVQVSSAAICAGTTGTLTATASGSAGVTFNYAWTGPAGTGPFGNTATITVSVAGTYTVVVSDSNGCGVTGTGVVVVNPNPIVTVSNPTTCQSNSAVMTATVTGSTAATFHYAWTGPSGTGPFPDAASIAVLVAGSYSVTVTDSNGCVGTGSGVLTLTSKPVVAVNNASICAGTTTTLTATVSGSTATPFHFNWNGPAGTGPFADAATITVGTAGTYSVAVSDANQCIGVGSGTVTVNAKPIVSVSSAAICAGTTGTLNAVVNGGAGLTFSYAWTGPAGTGSFPNASSITVSVAGTYNLTVTDSNGCTGTGSGVLVVNPNPVVQVTSPAICQGGAATVTATVTGSTATAFTYVWTGPTGTGPFGNTASIAATVAGNYCVTVTDANGCTGTGCGTVTVNPVPVVTVNSPAVCVGSTATVTATVTGSSSSPFTFAWSGPAGTGPFGNTASITTTVAGVYTVTVTDHNGCVGAGSGTVTVNAKPFVGLQPITICAGKTASLLATVDACAPFTFVWSGPGGFTATGNPASVTAAGTYTVTITDCHGCTSTASTTLKVDAIGCAINPTFCILCSGDSKTLTASPVGGIGPFTYMWSNGSTASTLTTNKAGIYTVTITDSLGCSSTCSSQVVIDVLSCGITPSCVSCQSLEVCNGTSLTLSGNSIGGLAPFQYVWSTGETTSSITVTQPGTYTLSVSDANGCTASFTATVLGCDQCVTRDTSFWFSHVVPPPGIQLPAGETCATLQAVFNLMPNGLMNVGFLDVTLNQALGLFWGTPTGPATGGRSAICAARKTLSSELIAAIANVTLLNANSSGCGVQDPNSGGFILIGALIQEAQAALQAEPNIFDCNNQVAWMNDMNGLTDLLHSFNGAGTSQPLPSGLVGCGVGQGNSLYIQNNQVDPTTTANCGCP